MWVQDIMNMEYLPLMGVALSGLLVTIAPAFAQGTAFTYQGRLNDGGNAAQGTYDLQFTLTDSLIDGNLVAGPMTNTAVSVNNGLFTVVLDFGEGVFRGQALWLEIGVRTNGNSGFTTLTPRQPLAAVPYAIMASTASNLLGTVPL